MMNKTFKELTFQFRYDKDKGSDLVAFYEEPHSFAFELFYTDKDKEKEKEKDKEKDKYENMENKNKPSKRQMYRR
jgi:hypothetical protein